MSPLLATLVGFSAVVLWGLLALFTAASGAIPPFQMNAMCFAIAGAMGLATWPFRPGVARALAQPWRVWALGVAGLFGYHALYFATLALVATGYAEPTAALGLACALIVSGALVASSDRRLRKRAPA